jgi:hypothetical protein
MIPLRIELMTLTALLIIAVSVSFFVCQWIFFRRQRKENWIQKKREERQSLLADILFQDVSDVTGINSLLQLDEYKLQSQEKLSRKKRYRLLRQIMIEEMLITKKNLTGNGLVSLYWLYKQLGLNNDSFEKLQSNRYQLIVMGIRELSEMNCGSYYRQFFRYTNHPHEDVRIEAQLAMVRLWGTKGLRFLSVVTFAISDWQQMTLLHLLNKSTSERPKEIEQWLDSGFDSVVILALRLSDLFNCFDLIVRIYKCLDHPNDAVKIQSVRYFKNIYDETTEIRLIEYYNKVDRPVQIAILETLYSIATKDSVAFLCQQIRVVDTEVVFLVVKILNTLCSHTEIFTAAELNANNLSQIKQMLDHLDNEQVLYNKV